MPQRRLAATRLILLLFGLVQVAVGVVGFVSSGTLSMGTGKGTALSEGLLAVISLSAVNTGLVYVSGAVLGWHWFPLFAIVARTIMGGGLLALIYSGKMPPDFASGAYFEFIGIAIILATLWWDERFAAHEL